MKYENKLFSDLRNESVKNSEAQKAADMAFKNLKYSEKTETEAVKLAEESALRGIAARIFKDNMRRALVSHIMPIVIEEFSKYNGKPYGPKTQEKISAAIKDRTDCHVYFSNNYGRSEFSIVPLNENGFSGQFFSYGDFNMYPNYGSGKRENAITEGNKINAEALKNYYLSGCSAFCDDVMGTAHQIMEANRKIKEAAQELRQMEKEYNALLPSGMEHANIDAKGLNFRF